METLRLAPFKREVPIGRLDTGYEVKAVVTVRIEWDGKRLSITGDATRPGPGDRMDEAGQMHSTIAGMTILYISADDRDELVDVWKRWHLNDMRAGCEHQRRAGWDKMPIDPSKPLATYGLHYEGQRHMSWNMLGWVRPDEHPDGLLTKPCGICGYEYGTAWVYEEVPDEVLQWLHQFARTDDEDRTI